MMDSVGTRQQPAPTGDGEDVTWLVMVDLQERAKAREKKYGTRLKTKNGRDSLVDLYQELCDATLYARQVIEERHNAQIEILEGLIAWMEGNLSSNQRSMVVTRKIVQHLEEMRTALTDAK